MKSAVTAIIPARSGSRSIRHKNIRPLSGRTLLARAIETALECGFRPVVSSDSPAYLDSARHYGAEVLLRPEELAGDETSMFDVLRGELPRLELRPEDIVVLLQCTAPFRKKEDILCAVRMIREGLLSVVSVSEVLDRYHPAEVFVMGQGWQMADGRPIRDRITRRQDYPRAVHPNGQFYVFRYGNILEGSIYGSRSVGVVETADAPNINEESDWELAERYANENNL